MRHCQLCFTGRADSVLPVYDGADASVRVESVCADCFGALWTDELKFSVITIVNGRWSGVSVISRSWFDDYAAMVATLRYGIDWKHIKGEES